VQQVFSAEEICEVIADCWIAQALVRVEFAWEYVGQLILAAC
jgi:hypothetical protein